MDIDEASRGNESRHDGPRRSVAGVVAPGRASVVAALDFSCVVYHRMVLGGDGSAKLYGRTFSYDCGTTTDTGEGLLRHGTWGVFGGIIRLNWKGRPSEYAPFVYHESGSGRALLIGPRGNNKLWERARSRGTDVARKVAGEYEVVHFERDGRVSAASESKQMKVTLTREGEGKSTFGNESCLSRYTLDPDKRPKEVDCVYMDGALEGKTIKGIYEMDEQGITFCYADPGRPRPTQFATSEASGHVLYKLRIIRKDK